MKSALLRLFAALALAWPALAAAQTIWDLDKCMAGGFMGLDLAIDYCERAIKSGKLSQRDTGTAHFYRARWYQQQGRLQPALADLDEVTRLDILAGTPDDQQAPNYSMRGSLHLRMGNLQAALADFDEAIRLNPSMASPYRGRGQVWLARRDADKALADFSQALKAAVGDKTLTTVGAGSTYARRPRNFDRTENDAAAHVGRGHAYLLKNDAQAALTEFNDALRVHPKSAVALAGRASLHERRGDWDNALADHSAAVEAAPGEAAVYLGRGRAWAAKGEFGKAALDFNATLKLQPEAWGALMNLGSLSAGNAEYGEADEQFGKVLEANASSPYVLLWKHLAQVRAAGADSARRATARQELARASLRITEKSVHAQLVEFYLGRGDEAELRKAGRNLVESCQAHYFLGQHHLIAGNQPRGAQLLGAVVRQCPALLQETWAARIELGRLPQ
ncbi:MAG TPA: tetratricopeptide repeat protein [Burkholderiales bacterium]|nr:tetratricopeptide repeat protein [Burkholderiales bacterium]